MNFGKHLLIVVALAFGTLVSGAKPLLIGDFSQKPDDKGLPAGWELKQRFGLANFSLCEMDGLHALGLRSTNTSFSLQRPVNADLSKYPILSWKWRVNKLPQGGDFRNTKTDDQAAQLFVAFSKTQFIVYIWDTTAPQGFMGDAHAPPFMSIKVVVVRSSPAESGKWLTESRNVADDYRKLYGGTGKPPIVRGVRLQINTQHTRTSAESYFAELMFKEQLQAGF
jgi:hypothetical protein